MRRTIFWVLTIALSWAAAEAEEPPGFPFDPLSSEVFDLLAESAVDSCAICAREKREEAFALLDECLLPGDVLRGTERCPFLVATGNENELCLACFTREDPRLTFRYHTAANHYVGIARGDFTADSLAGRLLLLPPDTLLVADIRIIPFPYGSGETFLYQPSGSHLQIQCELFRVDGP